MNLLLVGNHFSGERNNQNVWQSLANHLREAGYQIITTSSQHKKIARLMDMLSTIWRRRNDYELAQMDVFSGNAFTWAYLSAKLLKRLGKPFILTLHGGNLPEFSKHHPAKVTWLLEAAAAVTVPSAYLQEAMRPYRDDLKLIPNGLDINRYPYIHRVFPRLILVWLRAFHAIYNPGLAIKVLNELRKDHPEAKLIMAGPDKGDGSYQRTRQLAAQFGLEQAVEFAGSVPKSDVPMWLNKGDIFINTTHYDNAPVSVMEAMACGLCVVSTKVGGIPYLISDANNGILVEDNNAGQMAEAIKQIINRKGLAEMLSKNARKSIEKFDWVNILPQWEALINLCQK